MAATRILIVDDHPLFREALKQAVSGGVHNAAVTLAGSGEAGLIQALNDKMPTAAVALMSFARQRWRDIRSRDGNLVAYWTPKGA